MLSYDRFSMMTTRALRLILASQSPRRCELLRRAGFDFDLSPSQISEIPDENLNIEERIRDLARRKANACIESGKLMGSLGNLILSADTVVVLDGQILGKPVDRLENERFLRRLSARTHSVITAVCLLETGSGKTAVGHETSMITFKTVAESDLVEYVASGDGLDKAGGYGIQGAAGRFVEQVEGHFDNVIGLPVNLVEQMLTENGWHVDRR